MASLVINSPGSSSTIVSLLTGFEPIDHRAYTGWSKALYAQISEERRDGAAVSGSCTYHRRSDGGAISIT